MWRVGTHWLLRVDICRAPALSGELVRLNEPAMKKRLKGFKVKLKKQVARVVDGKLEVVELVEEKYFPPSERIMELIAINENRDSGEGPFLKKRVDHSVNHSGSISREGDMDFSIYDLPDEELEVIEQYEQIRAKYSDTAGKDQG